MKYTITVIDDNRDDITEIESILKSFKEIENNFVIDSFHDPMQCKEFTSDLYILDIDMPNENGFTLSKRIIETNPVAKVIFCTSHNDLVFDAFELETFYYVRKSDLKADLQKAIRKYFRFMKMESYIFLKPLDIDSVLYSHIIYFKSDGNYVIVHTSESKMEYRDRRTLKSIKLSDLPDNFEKISSSVIVNLNFISSIQNNKLVMKDKSLIDLPGYKINKILSLWRRQLMKEM